MNRYLISVLMVFIILSARGQKVLKLSSHRLDIANRNFGVLWIVDARTDTSLIGVRRVAMGVKRKVILPLGLASGLQSYCQRNMLTTPGDTIIMRIRKFSVDNLPGDAPNLPKVSLLNAAVSFYVRHKNLYYKYFDREYTIARDYITDEIHSLNVVEFLQVSLEDASRNSRLIAVLDPVSLADIRQPELPPIMLVEQYTPGVYMNVNEFLSNSPQYPIQSIHDDGSGRTPEIISTDVNGNSLTLAPGSYWGYCDGKGVFVNAAGFHFRLKIDKRSIGFAGFDYDHIQAKKNFTAAIGTIALLTAEVLIETRGSKHDKSFFRNNYSLIRSTVNGITFAIANSTMQKEMQRPRLFSLFVDNGRYVQLD